MAHPYHHSLSSVKKWGGAVDDYLPIHNWFDASKQITADFRHRALRHHAEGIFMAETIFCPTITLSSGRVIPTRWVGEQHVRGSRIRPVLRRLGEVHPSRALDEPRAAHLVRARAAGFFDRRRSLTMYGTYLRLDIAVHDSWRAVVRAAARKLTRRALRDPRCRAARKRFYREMLDYHRQEREIVATWRL